MLASFFDVRPSKRQSHPDDPARVVTPSPEESPKSPRAAPGRPKKPRKKQQRAGAGKPPKTAAVEGYATSALTSVHARFEAMLDDDENAPLPTESAGQAWGPVEDGDGGECRMDNVALANFDDWEAASEYSREEMDGEHPDDDVLSDCRDYEPESLDMDAPGVDDSDVSSSLDEGVDAAFTRFGTRRSTKIAQGLQGVPVYSGPQLICEDPDDPDAEW